MAQKSSGAEYLSTGWKQAGDFTDADGHAVALSSAGDNQLKLATNADNEILVGVVEKGGTVAKGSRIWRLKNGSWLTMVAGAAISRLAKVTAANAASPIKAGRAATSATNKTVLGYATHAAAAAGDDVRVFISDEA